LAQELGEFPGVPILTLGSEACRPTLGKSSVMRIRGFVWHAAEIPHGSIKSAQRNLLRLQGSVVQRDGTFLEVRPASPERIESARDSLALLKCRATLQGRVVIPSVHPAMILRGADSWMPVLRIDIGRMARWIASGPEGFPLEDAVPFIETSDPEKARRLLAKMGPVINCDIETDGTDPLEVGITCVGLADVQHIERVAKGKVKRLLKSRIVLLTKPPDQVFLAPEMFSVLRDALKDRTVVTHNGPSFDEIALARFGVTYSKREDTLIAHFAFASDKPKSLSFVSSIYNSSAPWKIKFKVGSEEKGVRGFGVAEADLPMYCAADIHLGSLAWIRMQDNLSVERRVYEHDMRHALLCRKMQVNGLLVDQERKRELSVHLRRRSASLLGQMRALLDRRTFSPSRPGDLRRALFKQLKTPTYLTELTPTGLLAVNKATLEKLAMGSNKAAQLARLIMAWRTANDVRKEYLDGLHLGADCRVHAHWRSYGTETGRPSARVPNLLNIPRFQHCPGCGLALIDGMTHKETCNPKKRKEPLAEYQCRDIYIAAPGHRLIYYDLRQSEMRFASALSGDAAFIEACRSDIHTANAKILFGGMPGALERLEDPKGKGKELRDIAKNCGFAIIYLAEAERLHQHLLEHGFTIDLDTCQDAIDAIRVKYWRYGEYVRENIKVCSEQGYLRSPFLGRKRWLGHFPKPQEVANFPVQSGVADVMNERLALTDQRLPGGIRHCLYQYDSSVYECPEDKVDKATKAIKEIWSEPVRIPGGVEFIQDIDLKVGLRWRDFE